MVKTLALMQHLGEEFFELDGTYYVGNEDFTRQEFKEDDELFKEYLVENELVATEDTHYAYFEDDEYFVKYCERHITEVEEDVNENYLVLTDDEANEMWDESLDSYIEECVLPEIPRHYRSYFDCDAFKDDCRHDGRGHSLATYDGCENEETVFFDGHHETLYIYRVG